MEPTVSGPTTDFVFWSILWAEVRHLLELLIWVLVVSFAAAAGVWCCGYAVREAWLKTGPPARRAATTATTADTASADGADGVAREAATGILEIERYLADVSPGRRPTRSDHPSDHRREQDPEA